MQHRQEPWGTVEAEIHVPVATVRVVHTLLPDRVDRISLDEEAYRFGFCLAPGPKDVRAGFPDRWGPDRFERLGTAFALFPGERVRIRSDRGRDTLLMCQLRADPIHTRLDSVLQWSPLSLEASLDIKNPEIRCLLWRLTEEARHPGFASQALIEAIAVQLAIELSRYCSDLAERSVTGGLSPWRLRLIDERLREVREAPTLAELAALCRLSVRQLTRGFRASHACSIGSYVAQNQADHARRLLATAQPVQSVAHSLGFSSSSAFARAFRRATGETPRQFRERWSHDA